VAAFFGMVFGGSEWERREKKARGRKAQHNQAQQPNRSFHMFLGQTFVVDKKRYAKLGQDTNRDGQRPCYNASPPSTARI
jgi:hypothetical protein